MKSQINWEDIYNKMSPKMLGICRRYVKSVVVAEDLMHEAFITVIQKADSYSGKGSFEAWICKITVNISLQYLRRQKKTKEVLVEKIDYEHPDITKDENQIKSKKNLIKRVDFTENELLEVIDKLPEHHKIVFNLYVFEGYKHKQIGKMLNIVQEHQSLILQEQEKKYSSFFMKRL